MRTAIEQHRVISIRRGSDRIERIRVTDPSGRAVTEWTVDQAVAAIEHGTDEFMVASTVWSPVEVATRETRKYLRTVEDSCDHSNLENLPEF